MSTAGMPRRHERRLAAELAQRRDRVARPLGRAALALEHVGAHASRRPRRDGRAGAARCGAPRPRPTRPRAASAPPPARSASRGRRRRRGSSAAPGTGSARPERLLDRSRQATTRPRRGARRSRRRRTCSSRCGTTSARAPACRRRPPRRARRAASSARPVTSHTGPRNARAASSVSGVEPSCETQHEQVGVGGGASTASSACTARPPVCAAWNDVPQPVKTTRAPSGSRRPRRHRAAATRAARARARLVSPGHRRSL